MWALSSILSRLVDDLEFIFLDAAYIPMMTYREVLGYETLGQLAQAPQVLLKKFHGIGKKSSCANL